jgi:uncharacterized membrane protein YbhN (UPF0104 family)
VRWVNVTAAVATLAVVVWSVGTGPFLDGLQAVDGEALAAACALAVLTTVCCAWRWRIVARGLGVDLPLGTAVAAYYRSLFLNVTLPGGILGDVHRGISHGRDTSDVGRGLRAVAWERSAGQVVQAALTITVLIVVPSPVHDAMPFVALALVAAAAVALGARAAQGRGLPAPSGAAQRRGLPAPSGAAQRRGLAAPRSAAPLARGRTAGSATRVARWRALAAREVRDGVLARSAWPAIALASALVVAGHATTFVIAARTAGATASAAELVPLALLVLLGAALPNIGGWGPREGVTAWAFAAAGLGASVGVATAVVYGVMVFVASLPGAAVLMAGWVRREALHV